MLRVLIADESEVVRKIAAHILTEMGLETVECASTLDLLVKCQTELPAAIIVDSAMVGALDVIRNIRALPNGRHPQIFYSLVKADLRSLMAGKTAGATDFLLKPFDRKTLNAAFAAIAHFRAA
jgi:two-component system chemotaxis response regulator CheY